MKNEKNIQIIENYKKLLEDLKIKYQYKEKENQQLKTLLKLRDKEIINLKKRLKFQDENKNVNLINTNNNLNEISQKYIQDLIKVELENIKKEQIIYWNKILTLENYELQYLAPKLTTGNNHNYNFASHKLINSGINNNMDKLYYNIKFEKNGKNRMNSIKKRIIDNNYLNRSLDFKNKNIESFGDDDKAFLNGSFNKILTKSKQTFNV